MSALILLVVVVAWAVVMVPFLLRRHDEVTESRSVDNFEKSMRVLSRRSQTVEASRQVVVPRRSSPSTAVTVTVNGTTRLADGPASAREALLRTRAAVSTSSTPAQARITAPIEPAAESPSDSRQQPSMTADAAQLRRAVKLLRSKLFRRHQIDTTVTKTARAAKAAPVSKAVSDPRTTQLARRRRTVLLLAALPIIGLALALVVSPWFWVVQALADVALLACVVHVRQESARAVARRRHQAELVRRARERESAPDPRPAYAHAAEVPAHLTAGHGEVVIEKQPDGTWTPVPVPVPTYVTAPRAPQTAAERPDAQTPVVPREDARTAVAEEPERRKAAGE